MAKESMKAITTILILITLSAHGQGRVPTKLGLGIVAIEDTYDESKIVAVYKDKDLKTKSEDFKLYGQINRVLPYYYKPDYGLCYFVCLEKTSDYFKVLINEKEEGFLKNEKGTFFKTWESLLINSTVQRLDVKSNPIKAKPGDNQETINLGYEVKIDRLQVTDVIEVNGEHWINVKFSKSGKFPFDKDQDIGTGWIKWKSGDELLVEILLLC
jgi:hypothetical protein